MCKPSPCSKFHKKFTNLASITFSLFLLLGQYLTFGKVSVGLIFISEETTVSPWETLDKVPSRVLTHPNSSINPITKQASKTDNTTLVTWSPDSLLETLVCNASSWAATEFRVGTNSVSTQPLVAYPEAGRIALISSLRLMMPPCTADAVASIDMILLLEVLYFYLLNSTQFTLTPHSCTEQLTL